MRRFKTLYTAVVILLAALTAALAGALILWTIGADVTRTYSVIAFEPLKNAMQIGEVMIRAIPLTIIALGISVAYRCGIINIGAEGQMSMGILAATAVALAMPDAPRFALLPLALAAGALGGAAWGFIPGMLKARLHVSELLSTVMLNYIAAQFYTFCLRGPMLDPAEITMGSGTPQSMRLTRGIWLDRLVPGTRIHAGVYIALALAFLTWLLLFRTSWGYRMRASGAGERAAKYGGIGVERYLVAAMVISGAFAGLAGAVEISGVHRRAIEGVTSGYGFSAIVVALFGGLHPAGIIPASLFFGMLLVGADMTQRMAGVPANVVTALQGVIILVIVATRMVLENPYLAERVRIRLFGSAGGGGEA